MKFKLQVISKEMVKPSSPTPNHLRRHQLSFLDQAMVPLFMPWIVFYPKTINLTNAERCNIVKKSLSEALTLFYPLAGRLKDNTYVECNDEGVPFVQTQANCTISDIIGDPIPGDLDRLIPYELDDVNDLGAVFQVTFFQCGGMAIGSGMSHKLGDAMSFFMFLKSWAGLARGGNINIAAPCFDSANLFPPKNFSGCQHTTENEKDRVVLRRFVFDAPSLATLRAKYAHKDNNKGQPTRPTRVEALSTFIWDRFKAATGVKANENVIYEVIHTVNLRNRMDPPLSQQYFGNLSGVAVTIPETCSLAGVDEEEQSSYTMISKIRDAISKIDAGYIKSLQKLGDAYVSFMNEKMKSVASGRVVPFSFTSLCRFPLRETDFGWGKPIWVASVRWTYKNLVTFFDTKEGDGMEAWINLKEEDMEKFEIDHELVAHVSLKSTNEVLRQV